jgi:hypothetical protein
MQDVLLVKNVEEWFPTENQKRYIDAIIGQSGLTRKQATCFVRLWGYAIWQQAQPHEPLTALSQQVATVVCSHRDAADLFYYDQNRGGERAAGLMIDQLVGKNLVKREPFDGGPTRLSLQVPDTFIPQEMQSHHISLYTDTFHVRNDTPFVAALLEESYTWISQQAEAPSFQITKGLRQWHQKCPANLRVLRTEANHDPIGFAAIYPIHENSEVNFHRPPSQSLYLSTPNPIDPMQFASPGDETCYIAFVRAWQIAWPHWNYSSVSLFLKDTQDTLRQMLEQYPNLSDVYTIAIHPRLELLASILGFKQMRADPNSTLRWIYMPLERLIALDVDEVLVEMDFNSL